MSRGSGTLGGGHRWLNALGGGILVFLAVAALAFSTQQPNKSAEAQQIETGSSANPLQATEGSPRVIAAQQLDLSLKFDPLAMALGVDTKEELLSLQAAQSNYARSLPVSVAISGSQLSATASAGSSIARPSSSEPVNDSLDKAINDLYRRVSDRPEAEKIRAEWQSCMSAKGASVESPAALELTLQKMINGATANKQELDARDASVELLMDSREQCNLPYEEHSNQLAIEEYPAWIRDNRQVIDQYAEAIGYRQ